MSTPSIWLLLLPLLAGALMPLQAGVNGQLASHLSSSLVAALLSFLVGTLALLAVVLLQRDLPALGQFKGLSWWHWTGGLMGAFFIATAAFSGPKIGALKGLTWWHWSGGLLGVMFIATAAFAGPKVGAVLFMALVIAGQLSMALTLDHFGWAGFREAPLSLGKLAGLGLVIAGVVLIQRG